MWHGQLPGQCPRQKSSAEAAAPVIRYSNTTHAITVAFDGHWICTAAAKAPGVTVLFHAPICLSVIEGSNQAASWSSVPWF